MLRASSPFAFGFGKDARRDARGLFLENRRALDAVAIATSFGVNVAALTPVTRNVNRAGPFGFLPQFLRRAVGDDLAAINDDGARTNRVDFLQNVRGKNDRFLFAHPPDQARGLRASDSDPGRRSVRPGPAHPDRE